MIFRLIVTYFFILTLSPGDILDLLVQLLEMARQLFDVFLHLDRHLTQMANAAGGWTYLVLFLVIFAETGLVVLPFLPGDSLLFAVGALAALPGSELKLVPLIALMFVAAVLGDAVNYSIGRYCGPRVFRKETGVLLNQKHLVHTQKFYETYGGKTIILARFMPIIRTFAPFVAGVGQMHYRKFAAFNVVGAFAWVIPFTLAGYFFGNLPFVKNSFHYVILAIIILSVFPAVYEVWRVKNEERIRKSKIAAT